MENPNMPDQPRGVDGDQLARPTPEAFRYVADNLDIGKSSLRQMVKDAADHMERMSSVMKQLQQLALANQERAKELEDQVTQKSDLINRLNANLAAAQSSSDRPEPDQVIDPSGMDNAEDGVDWDITETARQETETIEYEPEPDVEDNEPLLSPDEEDKF